MPPVELDWVAELSTGDSRLVLGGGSTGVAGLRLNMELPAFSISVNRPTDGCVVIPSYAGCDVSLYADAEYCLYPPCP